MWRHTGLSYVYIHLSFCYFCYFYLSSLDTCQPFSCLVLLHGFTKAHQRVRHWQDKREESGCELKSSLRSCSQTSSFNKKGHFFHCSGGNGQGGSKIQPRWSGFSVIKSGVEFKFSESLDSEWQKQNYKETANVLSAITLVVMYRTLMFLCVPRDHLFLIEHYAFLVIECWNYMSRHLDSAGLSPWNYVSSNVGHILIQMLIDRDPFMCILGLR